MNSRLFIFCLIFTKPGRYQIPTFFFHRYTYIGLFPLKSDFHFTIHLVSSEKKSKIFSSEKNVNVSDLSQETAQFEKVTYLAYGSVCLRAPRLCISIIISLSSSSFTLHMKSTVFTAESIGLVYII